MYDYCATYLIAVCKYIEKLGLVKDQTKIPWAFQTIAGSWEQCSLKAVTVTVTVKTGDHTDRKLDGVAPLITDPSQQIAPKNLQISQFQPLQQKYGEALYLGC